MHGLLRDEGCSDKLQPLPVDKSLSQPRCKSVVVHRHLAVHLSGLSYPCRWSLESVWYSGTIPQCGLKLLWRFVLALLIRPECIEHSRGCLYYLFSFPSFRHIRKWWSRQVFQYHQMIEELRSPSIYWLFIFGKSNFLWAVVKRSH